MRRLGRALAVVAAVAGGGALWLPARPVLADGASVAFADPAPQVNEGSSMARIVVNRLDLPVSRLVVNYATEAATAEAGSDFVDTRGTLVFEVGDRSATFVVPIRDDAVPEPTEHAVLRLIANQTSVTARLTIVDDDRSAPASASSSSGSVGGVDGAGGGAVSRTGGGASSASSGSNAVSVVTPGPVSPVRRRVVTASAPVRRKVVLRQNPVTPFELRPAAPSTSSLPPSEPTAVDPLLALFGGLLLARVAAEVWFRVRAAAAAG